MIGKSRDSRWRELLGRSLRQRPDAARRAARAAHRHRAPAEPRPSRAPSRRRAEPGAWRRLSAGRRLWSRSPTLVAWYLDRSFRGADLAMIFLVSVLVAAAVLGPLAGAAAAGAGRPGLQLLLPRAALLVRASATPTDVLTFVVFLAVAAGHRLADRPGARPGSRRPRARAAAITALLAASRRLSAAAKKRRRRPALAEQLSAATGGRAVVLLPDGGEIVAGRRARPTMAPLATAGHGRRALGLGAGRGRPAPAPAPCPTPAGPSGRCRAQRPRRRRRRSSPAPARRRRASASSLALLDQGAVALERAELAAEAAEAEALRRSDGCARPCSTPSATTCARRWPPCWARPPR